MLSVCDSKPWAYISSLTFTSERIAPPAPRHLPSVHTLLPLSVPTKTYRPESSGVSCPPRSL